MSTRLIVATAAAAVVTYFSGSPSTGLKTFALVYGATGFLDPNAQVQGPRLDDTKAPSASYGAPIAYIEGHPRISGNWVWCTDKREIRHESSEGGKGGPGVDTTTFTYEMDVIILLAENEGVRPRRCWSNGGLIWTQADDSDDASLEAALVTNAWREIRYYDGNSTQMPDPTYEAAVGMGNAPAYRGRSMIVIVGLNLGGSGQVPALTWEVSSSSVITNSTQLIFDVPFTGHTAMDVADDPITPVTLGSPDLSSDGYCGFTYDPDGSPQITYTGEKLEFDSSRGKPEVLRATITLDSFPIGGPNSDTDRFLSWIAADPSFALSFAFRMIDGNPILETVVNTGVTVVQTHAMPASNDYRIVLDGTYATFFNGDVPLRTELFPYVLATVRLGLESRSSVNVSAYTMDRVVVYYGSGSDIQLVEALDVPLSDVVGRQWQRAGLDPAALDVSDLSGLLVRSMAVTQITSPRQIIENLASAYHFEPVESGYGVRMVRRGGAPVATIPFADLGAFDGSSQSSQTEPLPRTRGNELEVPAVVTVKFSNVDDDYQDGSESSPRLATGSIIQVVAEIPLGLTPTEAKQIATIAVNDQIASLIRVGPIAMSRKWARLEPTDVVLLVGRGGSTYRTRLSRRTDAAGLLTFDGVLDDATVFDIEAVTSGGYNSSTIVRNAADTLAVLLDIPILRDADNARGIYSAARGVGTPWRGYALFKSNDDVTFSRVASGSFATVLGSCSEVPGDWSAGRVFDETNGITVDVGAGTLSASTRDALLADESVNAFAIGAHGRWELGQFRDCTLLAPGVYRLTGLLRGSRGTDWATDDHVVGEIFVLLNPTGGILRVPLEAPDLAANRYYRPVSLGRSLDATNSVVFAEQEVGLKPFSPFSVRADREPGGDAEISWQRRTRLAVRATGPAGVLVPLGEDTEAYSIDIYEDDSFSTVVRTLASSTPSVAYPAAMQTADFGSPQASIAVEVFQLSAQVGRGYPAREVV